MSANIAQGAADIGMVLSGVVALPQLVRLGGSTTYAGVSSLTWALGAGSYALWCTYGFVLPIIQQVPGNAVAAVAASLVLMSLARRGAPMILSAATLAALAGAAFGAYSAGGADAVGWLAFATSLVMRVPQVRLAFRAPSVAALSVSSWGINMASAASWCVYATLTSDLPILAAATMALVLAGGIIVGARSHSSRHGIESGSRNEREHRSERRVVGLMVRRSLDSGRERSPASLPDQESCPSQAAGP